MSNPWFQFKQFAIQQEYAAMKVSTDACIFGAWVAGLWKNESGKILDIGTGTGLLSLMILQENSSCSIIALEPEPHAAREASFNFRNSKWASSVEVVSETIQDFSEQFSENKFDFLISNPPFFQNHLLGDKHSRNQARHDSLTPEELAHCCRSLIAENGELAVVYPEPIWEKWLEISNKKGFHPKAVLNIQPTPNKPVNRICGVFSLEKSVREFSIETLLIRNKEGHYTDAFTKLLKGFYLNI